MLTLHPEILVKNGKKQFAVLPYEEFLALQGFRSDTTFRGKATLVARVTDPTQKS